MRWFWLDHFVEFISGERAVAIKNVTVVEEELDQYLPYFPVFPPTLIIEGLAHAGGLLVSELTGFQERVVLAKVGKAIFHQPVFPGSQLRYEVKILERNAHGALVAGTAHVGDQPVAEVDLMFAHLDQRFPNPLFSREQIIQLLHLYRLFDVGRTSDGRPLPIPSHLLEAAPDPGSCLPSNA